MKKLYEKSELTFAIVWIVIYCVLQSLANPLSEVLGIAYSAQAILSILMAAFLFYFICKNGLLARYGLCKSAEPARKLLWYLPLAVLSSTNLWRGVAANLPLAGTICYLLAMLCVGFLEEIIFRGFLFRAMARDNVRSAIIVSSITFGIGHILNLVNGSGMGLLANLCQICGAIAIGFLFVTIFHRTGCLIGCILSHSVINMLSVIADESGLTAGSRIAMSAVIIVIAVSYTLVLTKTLKKTVQA